MRSLPDLRDLVSLTFLDASFNQLTEVPLLPSSDKLAQVSPASNWICSSRAAAQVFLGNNALRSLDGIEVCKGLSTLDIRDNKIADLPPSLSKLPLKARVLSLILKLLS